MIIVMSNVATEEQIESVIKRIEQKGREANVSRGTERTVIGAIGDERSLDPELLESLPGVERRRSILLSLIKL
jgi:3-deoxy-7-phosphoheptulonate synthase